MVEHALISRVEPVAARPPAPGTVTGDNAPVNEQPTPAVVLALLAGACGAVQPKVNAVLGTRLGSSLVASLVNFGVAFVLVLLALAVRPATRRRLAHLRDWNVPWWTLTAGLAGVAVVLAAVVTVERIGVAVFSIAFFSGQLAAGLAADRLGIAPGGARPITAARLGALVLAIAAIVISQAGRDAGLVEPALVAFAVASGAGAAFQSAFNARIVAATGDPATAVTVNVVVGTVALVVIVAASAGAGSLGPLQWPSEPWLYVGGALGVTIVLTLAVATVALGVLRATLAMLAAQMAGALVVDWIADDAAPTIGVVVGSALVVGAVALVGRRPARVGAPGRQPGSPSAPNTS